MTATERAALTDALTAASAGPHPPPIDRLRAAAEYVIGRVKPDQLILFGSASRGDFRAGSDFDFFALKARTDRRETSARWTHPDTGDEIDLVFDDAEHAMVRRWLAGTVRASIFADGATVFAAPERDIVETLRDQGIKLEDRMAWSKFELGKAVNMALRCESRLSNADDCVRSSRKHKDWHTACQNIQECLEKGLKALIIAHGRRFEHEHDIRKLRTAAAEAGEKIESLNALSDETLEVLGKYGTKAGYDTDEGAKDPEKLFRECRPAAEEMVNRTKERVPELLDARDRERRAAQKTAI